MPRKHLPHPSSRTHRRKTEQKARRGTEHREQTPALFHLHLGNRALQRALLQRQAAARPGFNPLDPATMSAAAHKVIAANEAPVRDWLVANTDRLRLLTIDELVVQVRRSVAEAGRLSHGEIQALIREWAAVQNVNLPPISVLGAASPALALQIPDVVKKAFAIPIDGVDVLPLPGGRLNISVRGATAKLGRSEVKLGWGGNLGIDIPLEGFHLAGTLDKNRWELTLSAPGESSMPDLSKLTELFQEAETAMRGMVEATAGLRSLDDAPKVAKAVTPHVEPVKKAVQALVDMAKSPAVSAGISIGGPTGKGDSSAGGLSVTATVTIRF